VPVELAARRALAARLGDVRRYEQPLLDAPDIDDVHDMRVATRRLRAAIALFDEEAELFQARAEVKRLGDALGQVRDLDVLAAWIDEARAAQPEDAPARPGMEHLADRQREKREHKLPAMHEAIERFRDGVAERLASAFASVRARGFMGGPRQKRRLSKKLGRLERAQIETLASIDPHTAHQLRIGAKKLRYHAELLEDSLPEIAPPLLDHLARLQELLGDLHDTDVRRPLVEEFLIHSEPADREGALVLLRSTLEARERLAGELTGELRAWQDGGTVHDLRSRLK
jgi:CHAD domain-containing protein